MITSINMKYPIFNLFFYFHQISKVVCKLCVQIQVKIEFLL